MRAALVARLACLRRSLSSWAAKHLMVLATDLGDSGDSAASSSTGVKKACSELINYPTRTLRARLNEWAALWAARCCLVRCSANFFRVLATALGDAVSVLPTCGTRAAVSCAISVEARDIKRA